MHTLLMNWPRRGPKTFLALAALVWWAVPLASAVLPPRYHNARDLDAIVAFVRAHPRVMESLRSIDLAERVVRFGEHCEARFERPPMAPGQVGPAKPLQFLSSNCEVD